MSPFDIKVVGRVPHGITVRCLHVRLDGSIVILGTRTIPNFETPNKTVLYLLPAGQKNESLGPITLKILNYSVANLVELSPGSDVFAIIAEAHHPTNRTAAVQLLSIKDLRLSTPAFAVELFRLVDLPEEAQSVSGCCLLTPNTMLVADATAGCIWRIDSDFERTGPRVEKWFCHESLCPRQGADDELSHADIGLVFNEDDGYVYFTSPHSKLLARVRLEGCSLEPAADVEILATGLDGASRLLIDPEAGFAYVANFDMKAMQRIPISNVGDFESEATEYCLSLAGTVYPGVLAAGWCSPKEIGRAAFIVTEAEYLSLNLDQSHLDLDDSSMGSRRISKEFNKSKLVTRVIKVNF